MTQKREYRPFTHAEDKAIMTDRPAAVIAAEIGRDEAAVYHRRYALRNGTGRPRRAWDQEHDKAILDPDRPGDSVLADLLGRSAASIQVRRSRLTA